MPELSLKSIFEMEWNFYKAEGTTVKYIVVAVKRPEGAIELITNSEGIAEKVDYYLNAYDEDFCLKTKKDIKILEYMFVTDN